MENGVRYRAVMAGEEAEVCALVRRVFHRFVAPGYGEDGIAEFYRYVEPEAMVARSEGRVLLVAESDGALVGMVEMRGCDHISLLFVDGEFQGRGIGRELVRRALEGCEQRGSAAGAVTVNAAPDSVIAYESFGFVVCGPEETKNGIRFVPMRMVGTS